jgi:hypothetical protein
MFKAKREIEKILFEYIIFFVYKAGVEAYNEFVMHIYSRV